MALFKWLSIKTWLKSTLALLCIVLLISFLFINRYESFINSISISERALSGALGIIAIVVSFLVFAYYSNTIPFEITNKIKSKPYREDIKKTAVFVLSTLVLVVVFSLIMGLIASLIYYFAQNSLSDGASKQLINIIIMIFSALFIPLLLNIYSKFTLGYIGFVHTILSGFKPGFSKYIKLLVITIIGLILFFLISMIPDTNVVLVIVRIVLVSSVAGFILPIAVKVCSREVM